MFVLGGAGTGGWRNGHVAGVEAHQAAERGSRRCPAAPHLRAGHHAPRQQHQAEHRVGGQRGRQQAGGLCPAGSCHRQCGQHQEAHGRHHTQCTRLQGRGGQQEARSCGQPTAAPAAAARAAASDHRRRRLALGALQQAGRQHQRLRGQRAARQHPHDVGRRAQRAPRQRQLRRQAARGCAASLRQAAAQRRQAHGHARQQRQEGRRGHLRREFAEPGGRGVGGGGMHAA